MAISGVSSSPNTPSVSPSKSTPKAAPTQEPISTEPKDTVQITGGWLRGALKNEKPGAMFALDDFQPLGGQAVPGPAATAEWMATHGGAVIDTAKKSGLQGDAIPLEINRPLSDAERTQRYGKMTELWNNGKTPEDFQKSLYERALNNRTRLLDNATASLDDLSDAGAHNSVVNISASGSQAATVNNLLNSLRPKDPNDPESVAAARAERAKFATAFGVNDADLSSEDKDIQGAARQKLFQGVVDLVGSTQNDPRFVESKSEYQAAVDHFEAGNNSVVVAAGNDGGVEKFWENGAYGRDLKVSPEFQQNDLGVDNATVVGAARDWEGKLYPAEYNNVYKGVDFYANAYQGDTTPKGDEGSSYAAPRVAAQMANLHAAHPGLSSSQIENLMRNQQTGPLADYYGAPALPGLY
ncbi:MAG: S8 family serine peptidase [Candidatus Eremiobacteraeota bacterium]|nr:S8 family serine peptidase [Candidatus Eremiobacteraeota bacterium]